VQLQSNSPSSRKKVRDQRDHRENDEDVDEEAGHVQRQKQDYPKNGQNNRNSNKHLSPAFPGGSAG
jgi:hypothetical protein